MSHLALLWLHVCEVAVVIDVARLLEVRLVARVALRSELALLAYPAWQGEIVIIFNRAMFCSMLVR